MAGGEAKAALFDGLASVAQALGSGRRAEIVDVLAQGERSVDEIAELWAAVRDVAVRHLAEVSVLADEYLGDRGGVEQVSAPELEQRLARGDVVLLDVRPAREYAAGHIAGARSVPVDELDSVIEALPRRREIVAYCRGPYCVYADDAVRLLRARGRQARRLDVGFPEWRRAGLPVATA